jgi:hypothetical protein
MDLKNIPLDPEYLERLPPKLKEVVTWRHGISCKKLTIREIASRWQTNENWVKKSYAKAQRYLLRFERNRAQEQLTQHSQILLACQSARLARVELYLYLHLCEVMRSRYMESNSVLAHIDTLSTKPIEFLGLSVRAYNSLRLHKLDTIGDVLGTSEYDLVTLLHCTCTQVSVGFSSTPKDA